MTVLHGSRSALARALMRVALRLAPDAPPVAPTVTGVDHRYPDRPAAELAPDQRHVVDHGSTPGPLDRSVRHRAGSAARPRDEVVSAKRLAVNDHDVAGWVDREARAVRSIVASGLQLLDLSELHASYADRWHHVSTAIRRIVETTIDRHLSRDDLWVRGEGETWIILIAGCGAGDAARRVREIAADVTRRLMGDGDRVAGDRAVGDREPGAREGDGLQSRGIGRSEIGRSEIGIDTQAAAAIQVHSVSVALDEPPERIRTIKALLASWASTIAAARERERGIIAVMDRHVRPTYQPIFNPLLPASAAVRAIAGQRVVLVPCGRPLPTDVTGELRAALDTEALSAAVRVLQATCGLVVASIHFDTIAVRARAAPILAQLQEAQPAGRRRLILEIDGILPAVPQPRILSVLTYIYPLVLGVAVRIDPQEPAIDRFVGKQHRVATMTTDAILADSAATRTTLQLLRRRGMKLAVLDIPDERTARQFRRSRAFRFLAGEGVATSSASPIPIGTRRGRLPGTGQAEAPPTAPTTAPSAARGSPGGRLAAAAGSCAPEPGPGPIAASRIFPDSDGAAH